MSTEQEIKPVQMNGGLLRHMKQCNDDSEHGPMSFLNISLGEIVSFIAALFSKKKPAALPDEFIFDADKFRSDIIRQISTRSREAVLKQWEKCGIDRETAEYYMDYFAVRDTEDNKFDLIIPDDPATVFVWFFYEVYSWEEIGYRFGIYTYIWLYGFFFPEQIFDIPSPNEMSKEKYKLLYDNSEKFEYGMTMRRVVELILLYQNESNMNSQFFEPDIPTRPIECNPEWREKLVKYQRSEKHLMT